MGEHTAIAWTDHTFSPWEGCQRVSAGCENCYAEARNARFHPLTAGEPGRDFAPIRTGKGLHWGPPSTTPRLLRSASYWAQPYKWDAEAKRAGKRARVFCSSLADVFEDHPDVGGERARLFALIEQTPNLDWQLLTKRPENAGRLAPASWSTSWPANVWFGATAENAEQLKRRAPYVRQIPARVRFLSCEPLLEPLDELIFELSPANSEELIRPEIHWVIIGGESGRGARRFMLDWASRIVADCHDIGIACFMKQTGDNAFDGFEGESHDPDDPRDEVRPFKTNAHHGADPAEWPSHLRVQQFPAQALQSVGGAA